jgi:hypothetical protein
LSDDFRGLADLCSKPGMTYGDLCSRLGRNGHLLEAILFSMIFLVPVPLPGLSALFGGIVVIAGIRMMLGLTFWFPRFMRVRLIPSGTFERVLRKCQKWAARIEALAPPRQAPVLRRPLSLRIHGAAIAWGGLLLALPFPNAPPALGVILISVGILEETLWVTSLGYLVTGLVTFAYAALGFLGWTGLGVLSESLFG